MPGGMYPDFEPLANTDPLAQPDVGGIKVVPQALLDGRQKYAEAATTSVAARTDLGSAAILGKGFGIESPATANDEAYVELSEAADRTKEVFALSRNPDNYYEIDVKSDVTLEQYEAMTPKPVWELMEREVEPWIGKTVAIISSTFEGGGVAMQEPPLVHFLRLKGVKVHWLVSEPDNEAFAVTKKMHNLQQDVLTPDVQFTDEDKAAHKAYGQKNIKGMVERVPFFAAANAYWYEDPQLVGGMPDLMELNPDAKFIFRNHINTDRDKMAKKGSPQNRIYEYLDEECAIGKVDTYVAHPVEPFVPYDTPNVASMPPTGDQFEDLNFLPSEEQIHEDLDWSDRQIARQNRERQAYWRTYNKEHGTNVDPHIDDQEPLDRNRPLITGWSRWDRAKRKDREQEFAKLIADEMHERGAPESLIPIVLSAGNGATDDLDRNAVLGDMLELKRTEYEPYQDYIRAAGFEHNYRAVNSIFRSSMYTMNASDKEGWEHRRAESMWKGVPSLSTNAGGLPKQGEDGQGGLVANLDDIDNELKRMAHEVVEDLLNPGRYVARRRQTLEWAREFIEPELMTMANVIREARVLSGKGDRHWKISEILAAEAA